MGVKAQGQLTIPALSFLLYAVRLCRSSLPTFNPTKAMFNPLISNDDLHALVSGPSCLLAVPLSTNDYRHAPQSDANLHITAEFANLWIKYASDLRRTKVRRGYFKIGRRSDAHLLEGLHFDIAQVLWIARTCAQKKSELIPWAEKSTRIVFPPFPQEEGSADLVYCVVTFQAKTTLGVRRSWHIGEHDALILPCAKPDKPSEVVSARKVKLNGVQ